MIYKAYRYVYYCIYSWNLKQWGKSDIPEFNAMVGIAMLTCVNLLSVPIVIEAMTGYEIFAFPKLCKSILVLGALSFLSFHYFVLYHNGKYKKIIKEFGSESKVQHKRNTFWVGLYIFGSVGVLLGALFVVYLRGSGAF